MIVRCLLHSDFIAALLDCQMYSELVAIQGALRDAGAFGYPLLLSASASESWGKDKAAWAQKWSALRKSLGFKVWPVGARSEDKVTPRICQQR